MDGIIRFFDRLHYDPLKRMYWIADSEVMRDCTNSAGMNEFFSKIRKRGEDEFNRQFRAYMYEKRNTVAGATGMLELSDWDLDVLKMCEKAKET